MKTEAIETLVQEHAGEMGNLITVLENIQKQYGYLPEEALKTVSEETGKPLVDIYGVATFYKSFSLKPRGRHHVSVCLGTACHVRGAPVIAEEFQRQLGIKPGETTSDREFSLETVNCLGACALGPIVVVDGHYFSQVRKTKVSDILTRAQEGLDHVDVRTDKRLFAIKLSCPQCNRTLMDPSRLVDDLPGIRVTASFGEKHGWLCLSSLYGSYNISSEYPIPEDALSHFFCPHCHTELNGTSACPECGASMIPFIVQGGGVVQICSRRGCKGHFLDL